jgi:hypothetical protein
VTLAIKEDASPPVASRRWARLCVSVWTAALVLGANSVFPLEWSHPYCNNPTDGPAWAAYGLPLPYRQFSGVSSLTFNIMPHVLLLNILLLAALAYPIARMVDRRLARAGRVTSAVTAIPGILLLLLSLATLWLDVAFGFHIANTFSAGYDRYWSYRPIGISLGGHRTDCTPSEFWFGPIAPIARS